MKKISLLALAFLTLVPVWLVGQQLTLSPYSRYGIGDVIGSSTTRNEAMGGISIASDNYFSINRNNPASYADLFFTTLDVSGFGQYSSLRTEQNRENQITAGFQNLSFGFPTNNNFALVFGFEPYSIVGYEVGTTRENVQLGDSIVTEVTNYSGTGGINQIFIGGAVKLLKNRLRIGANFNYYFGKTNYTSSAVAEGIVSTLYIPVSFENEVFAKGVGGQVGVMYVDSLAGNRTIFRVGGKVDFQSTLGADQVEFLSFTTQQTGTTDTDTIQTTLGDILIPPKFGVGGMIGQLAKWSLGADFTYQDWGQFNYFGNDTDLGQEYRISVGGEWIPNAESPKYFNRMAIRAGGFFKRSYINFGDESIKDFGFTLGIGLPAASGATNRFARGRASSRVNIAFVFGKRGNITSTQPLEELYARVRIGFNINDTWFVRRVVD